MIRKALGAAVVVATIAITTPAAAVIGTTDEVPAATLLLPYFEVDLDNPTGPNTLLTVTNVSQLPAIAHFTLWTDWSVPTLGFNAYLTGYDVVEVDLRALFDQGTVPSTSSVDTNISPVGGFSVVTNPDTGVGPGTPSCVTQLPQPTLPTTLRNHIRASHAGQSSAIAGGLCSGSNFGDNVARGYITIDNVNFCTIDLPTDADYFRNGGSGIANNHNTLLGSYKILDVSSNTGFGGSMAHLEASANDPRTGPGDYTFYARYSGGKDNREPLATTFFAPFVTDQTDLIVWRDTKLAPSRAKCGSSPAWEPMAQTQLLLFDQEENPELPAGAPAVPFPLASNRVQVGAITLPTALAQGWLFSNLNADTGGLPAFGATAQSWITVVSPFGLGVSQEAFALDNASAPSGATIPCPPVGSSPCGETTAPHSAASSVPNNGPYGQLAGGSDR